MEKKENKIRLTSIDDLFTSQKERDEENLEKIYNIPVKDIDDFPNHPFNVEVNEEMINSIKMKGIIQPVLIRQKSDGRFEMISGHRRKRASEILNIDSIPCIIRNLTDDEATILMVDSNYQREKILPSEKAFAYKMKMEAMSNQGMRTDLTSSQFDTRLDTASIIGKEFNDSRAKVYRYIRLTYLLPKLLKYVDNSILKDKDLLSIAISPAFEISFLTQEEQKDLLDFIDMNQITPSQTQAIELKEMSQNKTFTVDKMIALLEQEKPNQTPKLRVSMNKLSKVLPRSLVTDEEREEYVIKAVEFFTHYQKQRNQKREDR